MGRLISKNAAAQNAWFVGTRSECWHRRILKKKLLSAQMYLRKKFGHHVCTRSRISLRPQQLLNQQLSILQILIVSVPKQLSAYLPAVILAFLREGSRRYHKIVTKCKTLEKTSWNQRKWYRLMKSTAEKKKSVWLKTILWKLNLPYAAKIFLMPPINAFSTMKVVISYLELRIPQLKMILLSHTLCGFDEP